MNTNSNSINTGLASQVSEFQWFKPTPNVHVEKVITTAPDYSIPPTPATSYSNLHVVLDTVHASTETITRGVIAPQVGYSMKQEIVQPSMQSRSIPVSMPTSEPTFIPTTTNKPPVDPLAERTDRELPEAVDIALVDESNTRNPAWSGVCGQIQNKNWKLKSLMPKRNSQWNRLGSDIRNKRWNLSKIPSRDAKYKVQWSKVGSEITNKKYQLRRTQTRQLFKSQPWSWVDQSESTERRWRMTRGIDALWSGRIHNVGKELMTTVGPIGWSQWLSNLKNKAVSLEEQIVDKSVDLMDKAVEIESRIADKSIDLLDSAMDLANDLTEALTPEHIEAKHTIWRGPQTWHFGTELYTISLPRHVPSFILSLVEAERSSRTSRGVDAVLSGKWYRIGREIKHTVGDDIADLFNGIKNQITRTSSDLINSAKDTIISMNTTKAASSLSAPSGLSYAYDKVDFTFRSRRVPSYIIDLEEAERLYRIQHGVNPILLGQWHQIGLELKYQYSIRPTLASTAIHVVEVAADLAGRAGEVLGEISERAIESGKEIIAQATPAPQVDIVEQDHPLNLFAYTAEPIDFTFKSRRCPSWIISQEEKERSDRIATGVDIIAYGKWNTLLSQPHKTISDASSVTSYIPSLANAKEALAESTKGFSGFLSSLAHNVADRLVDAEQRFVDVAVHNQYAEAAKGYFDGSSIASITKAEEAERVRRMDTKVDPMTAARLGRVQDELLHTVKSI